MMNQYSNTENIAPPVESKYENRQTFDASQLQTSSYLASTTAPETISGTNNALDSSTTENGNYPNSTYQYNLSTQPPARNAQDGLNVVSGAHSSSSFGTANAPQDYNGYAQYTNSSDPYGYGSTVYQGYYNSYQQQPNHSYAQPVGAYQNSGAPYQPLSSFQNTGSYAGSASYSTTYYNPGDYQTAGGYSTAGYSNQTTSWSDGNYSNYASNQYAQYAPDSTGSYNSGSTATSVDCSQQQYKQWADYYSQTEVSCAPGTENLSVTSTSNPGCTAPGASGGYQTSNSQPRPSFAASWRPESSASELPPMQPGAVSNHDGYWKHGAISSQVNLSNATQPKFQKPLDLKSSYDSFQDQQKNTSPQVSNLQYPITHQAPQSYQPIHQAPQSYQPTHQAPQSYQPTHQAPQSYQPTHQAPQSYQPTHQSPQSYQPASQTVPLLDTRRVGNLQIPTNPRIASNLTMGLPKTDKDSSITYGTAKPAYISVAAPKPNDTTDSLLKPGSFPKSLRGFVERALARCEDEKQMAACQSVLKETITKATDDGTLYSRDWDTEPLFSLPKADAFNKDNLQSSAPVSSLPKYRRSPSRRSKSRWEPLPEEKPIESPASGSNDNAKYGGWLRVKERDRKPLTGNLESKINNSGNSRFSLWDQKTLSNIAQPPLKKQRPGDGLNASSNGDTSSDSDKEQSLTAYYSGAIALANSPEERKRRENRSKRFERRRENNLFKSKNAGAASLYARKTTAMLLSKNFEDVGSRAVEDIDWDSLTVKGTCQEIEKRYLRLTSAPDPASVRPEEVLEKALFMVQNSQKNYLYKCDQLKSVRQDLTVQRIRNKLTVKVYETHARLALEVGDLPEYNQCQSQLKTLYAEGIEGCDMEFSAYNLLCVIMHSNNYRDLVSSMSRLSKEAKNDEAVRHALAVRAAVTSGNYVMFFRLYKSAPNLNTCLMDLYVEKMRYKAVNCMSRSYRPTVPLSYIAQVLGFTTLSLANDGTDEKDSDGLEECMEWLKAHGAVVITDNNGEMQLDTKVSSSSLFMPEPEDAVAHGDANLAVNDFFTRTLS